jgi:hypothetical protein
MAVTAARPCGPRSLRCKAATNPLVATPACCRRWVAHVLHAVGAALDRAGVPWCIDYGALLGYMTNGGLYWNDNDTDLCALVTDREAIRRATAALRRGGMRVRYLPPAPCTTRYGDAFKVQLSVFNKLNCDITLWTPREDGLLDRESYIPVDAHKGRAFPREWAFPATRGLWEGVEVNIPAEPELLVAHRYGEDWRNLPAARTDGVARGDYAAVFA